MIVFEELHIKNFLSLGEVSLSLEQQGLVLVSGENHDDPEHFSSNGAGKSSLFSAILFVLYGRTDRDIPVDEIAAWGKNDCEVALVFREGDQRFKVTRYRKHHKYGNGIHVEREGHEDEQEHDHKQQLGDIFGLDYETFRQSILFAQGDIVRFGKMTDSKQKEVLERVLQLEQLTQAQDRAKQRLRQLRDETNANLKAVTAWEDRAKKAQKNLDDIEKKAASHQAQRDTRMEEIGARLAELDQELDAIPAIDTDKIHQERKTLHDQRRADQKLLEAADENIRAQLRTMSQNLGQLEAQKKSLLAERNKPTLQAGSPCPVCGQPIPESLVPREDHLEGELESICAELESKQTEMETWLKQQEESTAQLREAVKANDARDRDLSECLAEAHGFAARARAIEQEAEALDAERGRIQATTPFDELIANAKDGLLECQQEFAREKAKAIFLEEQRKYYSFWEQGYGNKGLKSRVFGGILPALEKRANEYLRILAGDEIRITLRRRSKVQGEWREKMGIKMWRRGHEASYDAHSGGEKRRIDLALSLALSDIVSSRSSKQFNLLLLDEVFDSLDETGEERVVELLQTMAAERDSVFVVTHNPRFQQLFPREIRMVREGGMSRLEA